MFTIRQTCIILLLNTVTSHFFVTGLSVGVEVFGFRRSENEQRLIEHGGNEEGAD